MQIILTRWGNSLGLRIPKDIATRFGLTDGERVEIAAEADHIVISMPKRRYRLDDLLVDLTPEVAREAFDWGPDRGRERIE